MTILLPPHKRAGGRISPCHLSNFDQTPAGLLSIITDRGSGGDVWAG